MLWLNFSSISICGCRPWIIHCNIKQKSHCNDTLAYVCDFILIFPYIPHQKINVDFLIPNAHIFPWFTLSGHRKDMKFSKLSSSTTCLCTSQSKPRRPPPQYMWGFSGALSPYWQLFEFPVWRDFASFLTFVLRYVGHYYGIRSNPRWRRLFPQWLMGSFRYIGADTSVHR